MFNHSIRLNLSVCLCTVLSAFLGVATLHADGGPEDSGTVNDTIGSTVSWTGDAAGGGAAGEDTCADVLFGTPDVNCDQFELTIAPGDYTGKVVQVEIHWVVPADDYDLYIHKGDVNGTLVASSGAGAPTTSESAAIDPSATGDGLYTVHVVYFSTTAADQYEGSATTQAKPTTRSANYIDGAKLSPPLAFSPNKPLKAPATNSDGEPSNRTDFKGNAYICGIRGFPAGVDLWYFDLRPNSPNYDPNARNPLYRGQPDGFSPDDETDLGGDGGGDVDLAVGLRAPGGGAPPILAFSSLIAANLSVGNSTDRAQNYTLNPLGSSVPIDDRQWHGAYGASSFYLLYRTDAPVIGFIQRSNDGGVTYPFTTSVGPTDQTGGIDVNQKTGTVYASFDDGTVFVGDDPDPTNPNSTGPLIYTSHQATPTTDVGHLFCTVKVAEGTNADPDGVVYLAYSDDHDVFLVHSTDKGVSWSNPVRVSNIPGGTNIFPWIEVGSGANRNSVGVVWYGTTSSINDDSANWKTYYAFSSDATAVQPTFAQVAASDHFIHGSNISEGGLTGSANRNLLDYFQVSFDPVGAAVIGYTDDHNDFFGNCYGTRQISGPSIKGGNVPAGTEGNLVGSNADPDSRPPPQPAADGSQVTDFHSDVADALLIKLPPAGQAANRQLDIREIKYFVTNNGLQIRATMKLGNINPCPPFTSWRMNFSVNALDSQLSASTDLTNGQPDYTYGVSDRGDQFYFRANMGATMADETYVWGTAVRNSDGSITYTERGTADYHKWDGRRNTLTIGVNIDQLNAFIASGHDPIGSGTTLVGLRGSTFTTSGAVQGDDTYGGTQYTIP